MYAIFSENVGKYWAGDYNWENLDHPNVVLFESMSDLLEAVQDETGPDGPIAIHEVAAFSDRQVVEPDVEVSFGNLKFALGANGHLGHLPDGRHVYDADGVSTFLRSAKLHNSIEDASEALVSFGREYAFLIPVVEVAERRFVRVVE